MSQNIVIVNDYGFINGGAGKIAINTAIALAKKGNNVTLFCAVGPISQELIDSNVKVLCLFQNDINNLPKKINVIKQGMFNKHAKKEFNNLINSFNGEKVIVHIHSWNRALSSEPFKCLKKYKNVKSIITLHDYFKICPNGGLYDFKHKHICNNTCGGSLKCLFTNCDKRNYFQKVFRWLRFKKQNRDMMGINNYIYISKLNKEIFEKKCNNVNLYKVYNPVEKLDIQIDSCEKIYYVFKGRLSDEKGVSIFCEAIRITNQKGIVIGDGPLLNELKLKYKDIVFTGWLNGADSLEFISKSKCCIYPSVWYEGAPLLPMEMMEYGIPLICSNICAAREQIEDHKTGLIYDGTLNDLVKKIKFFEANDCYYKFKENIKKAYKNMFIGMDNYIDNLINCYNDIGRSDENGSNY